MLGAIVGFVLGIVSSMVANILWEAHGRKTVRRYNHWRGKRKYQGERGFLRLGENVIPWITVAFGPWERDDVRSSFRPAAPSLHPLIQERYNEIQCRAEEVNSRGEGGPFNGLGYKLESFWVGDRDRMTESPRLHLAFRPTDYFSMLASDQSLDVPLVHQGQKTTMRQEFASRVDLFTRPVPELATHFGIALQIVTKDGYTVFSERGKTAVDSHVFFPSVAEGCSRPADADDRQAPDVYRTAVRGVLEELGIEINRDSVEWISFGANAVLCEYGLIGTVEVDCTVDDLHRIREIGTPKDKWESAHLHTVRWEPKEVARFVAGHGLWSPFALVTVAHALISGFDLTPIEVDALFRGLTIRCSQELPR